MSVYLHDIPLSTAQERFRQALHDAGLWCMLATENLILDENACGRVLAEPVWAKQSSPHYHASAMDGFAVRSHETNGAGPTTPLLLSCGEQDTQAVYLDTGDPIPDWADAVIPIELVESLAASGILAEDHRKPQAIRIRAAVTPWSHIRPMGEDIIATQLVLPSGHILRPVDLGAIAASGHDYVTVARRPKIAIIPTGTELTKIGQPVKPGEIIEFNSIVLAAQIIEWGGAVTRFSPTPDDLDLLQQTVLQAAKTHDGILINAGSSAGSEDFTAQIVQNLGTLLVHGVAVRPGHPVILGILPIENRYVPVIGVPGYPVSAALTGEIFIEPVLARWTGRESNQRQTLEATLTRKITSPPGDDDFVRVAIGKIGDRYLAAPLTRGAGVITSLVKADGLAIIPRGTQGMSIGSPLTIHLFHSKEKIDMTILIIGSHDISLDVLAQHLAQRGRRLSSANVGSQGGLLALRRGETHIAGSHLLDPESGEYNLPYLPRYLPDTQIIVLGFVFRTQGLIVAKGNPKRIKGLNALVEPNISYVNRQRGAGTRVLLDYELSRLGINPQAIRSYEQEEFSHLAVAAAIASGRGDCGLGIAAAALALELDFIPLVQERYDLIMTKQMYHNELLAPMLSLLNEPTFKKEVSALPGYDTSRMGDIIVEYNSSL
jgi:putative molybdopterin biosynthesis protein